jgi:hypothetical protein
VLGIGIQVAEGDLRKAHTCNQIWICSGRATEYMTAVH